MHRTQLLLEDWQYRRLKALSEKTGMSLSHLVRDILSESLRTSGSAGSSKLAKLAGVISDRELAAEDVDAVLYGPDPSDS